MYIFNSGLCLTFFGIILILLLSFDVKSTTGFLELSGNAIEDLETHSIEFVGFQKVREARLSKEYKRPKKYQDSSKASPRFINPANPFGIFGTPNCQHDSFEGSCKELFQCWTLGGKVGPLCRRLRGVCCRFFRTCGQRSSQEIVYFSNNKFDGSIPHEGPPKERRRFADLPPECDFQIIKRNQNFCGLRVEPSIDASLVDAEPSANGTSNHESCADAVLSIVGVGDRLDLSLCNQRDAYEKRRYDINITDVRDLKLKVSSFGRAGAPVDIKVRQIKCEEFDGEDLAGTLIPGGTSGSGTSGGGTSGGGTSGGGTSGGGTAGGGTAGGGTSGGGTAGGGTSGGGTAGGVTSGGGTSGGTTGESGGTTEETAEVKPPAPPIPITEEPPGPPAPPVPVTEETAAPPPAPPSPPTPPGPNFAACGIKGPGRRRKSEEQLLHVIENLQDAFESHGSRAEGPPIRALSNLQEISGPDEAMDDRQEDLVTSWDVPTNNETIFYYLMGEPSLLATRITNGIETQPDEFPWQVAIFKSDNRFHCGASIIGDFYVLTAGHCVINFVSTPQSLVLRLGEWSLSGTSGGAHVNAQIAKITVHPEYSRTNLQNDVAVLKLKQRIDFNEKMRPVCLPKSDIPLTGELATITGWGKDERGSLVDKMNKLTAAILENVDCSTKWGGSGFIQPSMMCMNPQIGDSCNGDSGGPSVMEYPANSGKYFQVGIVSFGSGSCTDKNLPGVYTRVGYFRDWIIRQMV